MFSGLYEGKGSAILYRGNTPEPQANTTLLWSYVRQHGYFMTFLNSNSHQLCTMLTLSGNYTALSFMTVIHTDTVNAMNSLSTTNIMAHAIKMAK